MSQAGRGRVDSETSYFVAHQKTENGAERKEIPPNPYRHWDSTCLSGVASSLRRKKSGSKMTVRVQGDRI
jgi:hypothetical protein